MMLSERLLQKIEEEMANRQGRKPCDIEITNLPISDSHIMMYYDRYKNTIVINKELIQNLDEIDTVIALVHEGRHAYQWQQIMQKNHKLEPQLLLDIWRYDFENYSEPLLSDSIDYLGQGIEVDAMAFTAIEIKRMFNQEIVIPEAIKSDVLKRKRQILKQKNHKKTE